MDVYEQIQSGNPLGVQNNRPLKLDTPAGKDVLVPLRAVGHSRIGRGYSFTVDMVSTSRKLELKQLIAQPVTLWMRQNDKTYKPHHGYVHTVRRLGMDGGLVHTQLEFASWLHFLRFRKDARIWQGKTVIDILTDVFNAHPQARGRFKFKLFGELRDPLPQRSFCMQYEDDWNFVHRLLESEGLWFYFEQSPDGQSHTMIITDYNYYCDELQPGQIDFSRAQMDAEVEGFSHWSGTRRLQSTRYTGVTGDYKSPGSSNARSKDTLPNQGDLPQQAEVYEYTGKYTWPDYKRGDHLATLRMEEMESRAKRFHGAGSIRRMDAGRYFELRNHPDHQNDGQQEREFLAIDVRWFIANNLSTGNTRPLPGSLETEVADARADYLGDQLGAEKTGSAKLSASASGGSAGFFLTLVEAQRMSVPYRSPFEHRKPQMRIQTATVTGPAGSEVYTDSLNRIKGKFEWDRLNSGDENASCWLRVAMSDTGGSYGGVHVPRVGEEILVDWVDGDCDRPIVTGRVYNGSKTPNWHSNGLLSGFKSKEYGGSGYNQLVMDDSTGQSRMQLYSSTADTALHLGYLITHTNNTRGAFQGAGFDLNTRAYGTVRASQGMYVTTHQTTIQPMDASDASAQLSNAEATVSSLSDASVSAQAESLADSHTALAKFNATTQHSVSNNSATGGSTAGGGTGSASQFKEPILLMASPKDIGLSTKASSHVTADDGINLVSGGDTALASGKSFIAGVKEKISLFAYNAGIKIFAAKGPVALQAQSDNIEITAQKVLKLLSTTSNIDIAAKRDVLLTSGNAYIRIADGNIQIHAPGTIDIKGSEHAFNGPASQPYPLPQLPGSICVECLLRAARAKMPFAVSS
ncbi:type VI secretion system Vgr family protein [Robbsia andropogonis]|uniref:type VI secretion system Vgr family protein n=1 Tax=Robbsia andropogonis TaxID=28092 RepID=UPI00209EA556|nr:type VI secretion system Vgr family protein [Robbsia andropogonis]MCP1121233.1 type VI secretion system tip protein VgrG [Robbsia andropogonis]MCP1131014.1 type VI secretion system tip protein VgrG [Robbsia andropogonis]